MGGEQIKSSKTEDPACVKLDCLGEERFEEVFKDKNSQLCRSGRRSHWWSTEQFSSEN